MGIEKIQGASAPYRLERAPIGARGSLERVAPPHGARSTATKETLRAGGGYSPRPSRKPDPDDLAVGLFIIIQGRILDTATKKTPSPHYDLTDENSNYD